MKALMPDRPTRSGPQEAAPGLRVVRRRSRGLINRGVQTRLAPVVICSAICIATVIVGVLLAQVVLAQSAFKLARVRNDLTKAQASHQELLLEATKLESPERIEAFARDKLGMVEPGAVEYLVADIPARSGVRLAFIPEGSSPAAGVASP